MRVLAHRIVLGFLGLALGFFACTPARPPAGAERPLPAEPPPVAREFRAAWVASVANIDWPSEPGLSPEEQRRELVAILDRAVELNLNAIILQVRPAGDALYDSRYEPWSEYLTGTMGQPPEPVYDPLAFAVEEAHRRGLELHAWFNPFRARHRSATSPISSKHISQTRPELVREYGGQLWMDPGEPAVREHSLQVILDVVRRYDIDGVHLDDYFYPYPVRDSAGETVDFPDDASWERYVAAGGTLSRADWRRRNVDLFIERLYREIRHEKPGVKFGISPFGIWRPGVPESITGFDAYDRIYADSRKWLRNGWVDYFTPQLYWPVDSEGQSYPVLLGWWVRENEARFRRHVWPGLIPSRVSDGEGEGWPAEEILRQIRLARRQPGAGGTILFSMRALMENTGGVADALASGPYRRPALVPASPWIDSEAPGRPEVRVRTAADGAPELVLRSTTPGDVFLWLVQARYGDEWTTERVPGHHRTHRLERRERGPDVVFVSAVDRAGNLGPYTRIIPPGR